MLINSLSGLPALYVKLIVPLSPALYIKLTVPLIPALYMYMYVK